MRKDLAPDSLGLRPRALNMPLARSRVCRVSHGSPPGPTKNGSRDATLLPRHDDGVVGAQRVAAQHDAPPTPPHCHGAHPPPGVRVLYGDDVDCEPREPVAVGSRPFEDDSAPSEVARPVECLALDAPHLAAAQQDVVGDERSRPLQNAARRRAVVARRHQRLEVLCTQAAHESALPLRPVLLPHPLEGYRRRDVDRLWGDLVARLERAQLLDRRDHRRDGVCLQSVAHLALLHRALPPAPLSEQVEGLLVVARCFQIARVTERLEGHPLRDS
eukprot:7389889-Prymnesium_polylepis.3